MSLKANLEGLVYDFETMALSRKNYTKVTELLTNVAKSGGTTFTIFAKDYPNIFTGDPAALKAQLRAVEAYLKDDDLMAYICPYSEDGLALTVSWGAKRKPVSAITREECW